LKVVLEDEGTDWEWLRGWWLDWEGSDEGY